jgi:hypothetical protein
MTAAPFDPTRCSFEQAQDEQRRRLAARACGLPLSATWDEIRARQGAGLPSAPPCATGQEPPGSGRLPDAPPHAGPVHVRIPYSRLVSDNDKYTIGMRDGKPRLVLTARYSEAKADIRAIARLRADEAGALPSRPLWPDQALTLVGRVYYPRSVGQLDPTNLCKITHDALETALYAKDAQLHRVTWEKAGVDIDAPRAELTIRPLSDP